jgi:fucose 4-O-acetylase-like acetyltransferase
VIAVLAPVMSLLKSPSVPWLIRAYVFPDYNYFGFFPWAAFLAFGMACGSLLRVVKPEQMHRLMLWTFAVGLGVTMLAHYLSNLPYSLYSQSDFWLNSPGLVVIKTGFVLCILSLAYLWVNVGGSNRWSIFRQLGTTSLLVYWVHVELVYGRWFGVWKEKMTVTGVVVYTLLLTALMILLSIGQTRYKSILTFFSASRLPQPQRVSGD